MLKIKVMNLVFEQEFKDGTQLWCHQDAEYNLSLGVLGNGIASDLFWKLRTNEDIQEYIKDNNLCPNDFCENGYIYMGYNEYMRCCVCNENY